MILQMSLMLFSEVFIFARNFILFGQPDVTLVVVDATRLERNLNLCLQILEITPNVVVCVNLMDEATRKGISIDTNELVKTLNVPVVATTARYGEGMNQLLAAIENVASQPRSFQNLPSTNIPHKLQQAISEILADLKSLYPDLPNSRWIAMRLLEGDSRIQHALENGELTSLSKRYNQPTLNLEEQLRVINREAS